MTTLACQDAAAMVATRDRAEHAARTLDQACRRAVVMLRNGATADEIAAHLERKGRSAERVLGATTR